MNKLSVGSHNSGAYQFDFTVPLGPSFLRKLALLFVPFRNFLISQSRCQKFSFCGQLRAGVRILDLRIAFAEKRFWLAHTFACVPLEAALQAIRRWRGDPITLLIRPDFYNRHTIQGDTELLLLRILRDHQPFCKAIFYGTDNWVSFPPFIYSFPRTDYPASCSFEEIKQRLPKELTDLYFGVWTPPRDCRILFSGGIERNTPELHQLLLEQSYRKGGLLIDFCDREIISKLTVEPCCANK